MASDGTVAAGELRSTLVPSGDEHATASEAAEQQVQCAAGAGVPSAVVIIDGTAKVALGVPIVDVRVIDEFVVTPPFYPPRRT